MVKPNFSCLKVDFWVHRGKLGVTQPTLCLFHDSVEIGSPLLDALNELKTESRPAQRTLTFVGCSRERALRSLRLIVVPKREDLQVMCIRSDSDAATIEVTDDGLELLMNAFTTWLAGGEDFGVAPRHSNMKPRALGKLDLESSELWFWGPGYAGP